MMVRPRLPISLKNFAISMPCRLFCAPLSLILLLASTAICAAAEAQPQMETIRLGKARLELQFAPGFKAAARAETRAWVQRSAQAVAGYFGRFPVERVTILLVPQAGNGVDSGTTYNEPELSIRVRVGRDTSRAVFLDDWVMVHEMMHLAIPDVPANQTWFHEGVATYAEIVARAQAGLVSNERVWSALYRNLQQGLPQAGDRGLDHTPTWGRTYWGGALFCFLADLEIRQGTQNRLGLKDALRGIVDAGGNYAETWPLRKTLNAADRAVGLTVLADMHAGMKATATLTDLGKLWRELGVGERQGVIVFDDAAPKAALRRALLAVRGN